jgi:hypothetical protein
MKTMRDCLMFMAGMALAALLVYGVWLAWTGMSDD